MARENDSLWRAFEPAYECGLDAVTHNKWCHSVARYAKAAPFCRHLCQAGWAAVATKGDSYLPRFSEGSPPDGNKRATMAVRHAILVIAYCLLKCKENYFEVGLDYFDKKNAHALRRSLVRRLERLGNRVILEPAVQGA